MKAATDFFNSLPPAALVTICTMGVIFGKPVVVWIFNYLKKADKDKDKKIKSQEKRNEEMFALLTAELVKHRTQFNSKGDEVNLTTQTLLNKIEDLKSYVVKIEISHATLMTKFEERFGNVLELKADIFNLKDEVRIGNGKVIILEQNFDKIINRLQEIKKAGK